MSEPPQGTEPPKLQSPLHPSGLDVLLVLAVGAVMLIGAMSLSTFLSRPLRELLAEAGVSPLMFAAGFLGIQYLGLLAAIQIIVLRRRSLSWSDLGLRPVASKWVWKTVWVTALSLALVQVIMFLVQAIAGEQLQNPQESILTAIDFSMASFLALLLVAAGLAPLVEELLFRGLLYAWIRRYLGILPSAALSALLFAALHGIPWLIPALFAIGVVLALLYERSGSLWPAIAVHSANNAVNLIVLALVM